jgi:hypothetical protein
MKKRKRREELRKRKEEGRKRNSRDGLLLFVLAEKLNEQGCKAAPRPSAKDILYVPKFIGLHAFGPCGEVVPSSKINPHLLAMYLAHELFLSPELGERKVALVTEFGNRLNKRFVRRMLKELAKYRGGGKEVFNELDRGIVELLVRKKGRISNLSMGYRLPATITAPITGSGEPNKKFKDLLKKRMKRLLIAPESKRRLSSDQWCLWMLPNALERVSLQEGQDASIV